MDTSDGRLFTLEEMKLINKIHETEEDSLKESLFKKFKIEEIPKKENLKPMEIPPTKQQMKRRKIGRNEQCPCGSGIKFKKCCLQNK